MKVALIGATGFVGSALLAEALQRGHQVTALARNPAKLAPQPGLTAVAADVTDADALAAQLRGHDAVIGATSGHAEADVYEAYLRGFDAIVAAVKQAGVPRLLMVGGAASLQVAPGVELLDTPQFPDAWKATARGAREALVRLRREPTLDWTVLSPSAFLEPGPRTGVFRLGTDQLLADANGRSAISLADYAVAMLDELATPAHRRQRFTVGY